MYKAQTTLIIDISCSNMLGFFSRLFLNVADKQTHSVFVQWIMYDGKLEQQSGPIQGAN